VNACGSTRSFIRYPGSKAKLTARIIDMLFPESVALALWAAVKPISVYCEPFVGAGAMAADIMPRLHSKSTSVWLNDKDYWITCMWQTVQNDPEALCALIREFEPSQEHFVHFKSEDGRRDIDPVLAGFRKLALHQMSYSGLGCMAGSALGGKDQTNSEYSPKCRWKPARLQKKIWALHDQLQMHHAKITCRDFAGVLQELGRSAFVYADPPYYEKGKQLYKHNMEEADHARLAELLKMATFRWVLSYDGHDRIRELYSWARIEEISVTYTTARIRTAQRPKNHEIVITR